MTTGTAERTARIEREMFLRTMGGARISGESTKALADAMVDVFVPAGSALYRQGEDARIYFVARGEVHLLAEGKAPWIFKDRSVIGILDVLLDRPHARTAVAITDIHALRIRGDEYFDIIEDNFEDTRRNLVAISASLHGLCCDLAPDGGFPDPPVVAARAGKLGIVERITLLRESEAFSRAGVQALASLAAVTSEVRLEAGELLFEPGMAGRELYLVASGVVAATSEAPVAMRTRHGRGALVCGYGSLAGEHRHFAARAEGPATLIVARHEDTFDVMEEHFRLARSVFSATAAAREHVLAEKVRRLDGATREAVLPELTRLFPASPARP